jgi:hypothetical protein
MILVITILVLNHVFGWSKYLMAQENIDMLKNMVKENFLLASLIYIGSTVIASVLLAVPGVTFAIIAGLLFGPWIGTLLCSIAATLGAVFSFIVGRFFLKDSIKPMAVKNKYLKKWLFSENGYDDMFVLMITRLIPVFPYNLQNFAYGTTDMKLSKYTIGTFIFIVPGTAMYTVGAAGFADEKNRIIYIAAAILIAVVVSIIGYLLKKRYIKTGENIEQRSEA